MAAGQMNIFKRHHLEFRPVTTFVLAMLIGGYGGALFSILNLPLPWILGSMIFSILTSTIGISININDKIAFLSRVILALTLGSQFKLNTIINIYVWMNSIIGLILCTVISTIVCYLYLHRIAKYSSASAFYSATPGGSIHMIQMGIEEGGDERVISLTHAIRLTLVVLIIPFIFQFFNDRDYEFTNPKSIETSLRFVDFIIMFLSGGLGVIIAKLFKIPAGEFTAPLFIFAAFSIFGVANSGPPDEISDFCQVIIGIGYGSRFKNVEGKFLFNVAKNAFITTIAQIYITLIFCIYFSPNSEFDLKNLIIAYAPGGQIEMGVLALSLGGDIYFNSVHHIVRTTGSLVIGPLVYKYLLSKGRGLSSHQREF